MDKTNFIGVGILLFLLIITFIIQEIQFRADEKVLNSVKSGEKVLTCHMLDGIRAINKDLVIDYEDGVFYFVNGSSKTCSLK